MARCLGLATGLLTLVVSATLAQSPSPTPPTAPSRSSKRNESAENAKLRSEAERQRLEKQRKDRQAAAVPLGMGARNRFNHDFQSWQERQQHNIVMQQMDYSCGAAALATMARYYFEEDVTESEVLDIVLKDLDKEEVKDREENGLSMDDLFNAAKRLGYQATVYDLELKKIKELKAPIIVRTIKDDYKHFVVLRGVVEDRVWLADPIRGHVREPVAQFAKEWNNVALFLGKEGFGLPTDYPLAIPKVEVSRPELQKVRRSLAPPFPIGVPRLR